MRVFNTLISRVRFWWWTASVTDLSEASWVTLLIYISVFSCFVVLFAMTKSVVKTCVNHAWVGICSIHILNFSNLIISATIITFTSWWSWAIMRSFVQIHPIVQVPPWTLITCGMARLSSFRKDITRKSFAPITQYTEQSPLGISHTDSATIIVAFIILT